MNISKTQWMIIAVVGAVAVWYFFFKKKAESGYTNYQLDGGMLESGYTNYQLDGGSLESGYLVGCSRQECAAAGLTPGGNGCCYKTSKAMTAPTAGSIN